MTSQPHQGCFHLCSVVLVLAVLVTICGAQQVNLCPTEECNVNYRAQLESVNEELRAAVEKVNKTLAEQKQLINSWKSCKDSNDSNPVEFVAEKLASLEPCAPEFKVRSVTQVDGRIFVLCQESIEMRVYNLTNFQQLPSLALPIPTFPKKYPSYIIANRFEKALYLGVDGEDPVTGSYYSGNDIFRTDMSFNWVLISTAKEDPTFNIFRLRVARNGQMMYANQSHILFPQSATSFSRAINFALPPLNQVDYIQGLQETNSGSFVIYSQRFDYLIEVSSTGSFIGNTENGAVAPSNTIIKSIQDLDQGPSETLLFTDAYNDRIIIIDAATKRMVELITKSSGSLWGPYALSFDPQTQLLIVGEDKERSNSNDSVDKNSVKIFRINPNP